MIRIKNPTENTLSSWAGTEIAPGATVTVSTVAGADVVIGKWRELDALLRDGCELAEAEEKPKRKYTRRKILGE